MSVLRRFCQFCAIHDSLGVVNLEISVDTNNDNNDNDDDNDRRTDRFLYPLHMRAG